MSLRIENLNKFYGNLHALKNINLEAGEGEFLALVGASGCGKSTLLGCIAGLEETSGGCIYSRGANITNLSPKERDIAMVFQSYALYPNMTARENIAFGLKMKKLPAAAIAKKIGEVAEALQIVELLERKPAQLSGGQQQRVAMGRAIARDPALFLFDEPLSNLDAKLRVELRLEIKKLHRRSKKNVVYVTHDQVEAMTLADKLAVMRAGEVAQVGAPAEVYARPKNVFVARFIGASPINLFEAVVEGEGARPFVEIVAKGGAPAVAAPAPPALAPRIGKKVLVGIRPENINDAASDGGQKIAVPSPILMEENTGADAHLFTAWNGAEVRARCAPRAAPQAATTLCFPPTTCSFSTPTPPTNPEFRRKT